MFHYLRWQSVVGREIFIAIRTRRRGLRMICSIARDLPAASLSWMIGRRTRITTLQKCNNMTGWLGL
jgi:hypothetical protein